MSVCQRVSMCSKLNRFPVLVEAGECKKKQVFLTCAYVNDQEKYIKSGCGESFRKMLYFKFKNQGEGSVSCTCICDGTWL